MYKLFLLLSLLVPLGRSHWLYGKYRTNTPAPKPRRILSMEFTATKSPFFMKDSGASLDMKSFRMTDSDVIMNCNVGLRKPCGTDNERDCHRWKCCWDPNARIKCSKSYFIITDPRVCGRAEGPLFPGTSNEIAERPRPMYDLQNNFLEIIIMKVAGATNQEIISRIVNGLPTTTKDWPWIARLYERNAPSTTICGGAIIATQWILTAAHCLTTLDPSIYGVNVGDTDSSITEPEQQNFDAQLLIRHPDYQSLRYVNDIALIKLNRKMTYSDYVIPICLPSQGFELASDYDVYFAGWGYTVPNDPASVSNTLNVGGGKSILDSVCEVVVPSKLPGEAKLCLTTGSGLSDACDGDSGGPATALINEKFYLVGLTSYSDTTNCNSGTPAVYTKVSAFKDWILANIGA